MSLVSNAPLCHTPSASGWLDNMTVKQVGGLPPGHVTVSYPDGQVLAVNPLGLYEKRPAGTAGPYEVAQREGDKLIYRPGTPYVILTVG